MAISDRGYIAPDQTVPDGVSAIPIRLPSPAMLDSITDELQHSAMCRLIPDQVINAIATVHDAEHEAYPDTAGGDHRATSDVTRAVTNLITDCYGERPDLLVRIVIEMCLVIALDHDDADDLNLDYEARP